MKKFVISTDQFYFDFIREQSINGNMEEET